MYIKKPQITEPLSQNKALRRLYCSSHIVPLHEHDDFRECITWWIPGTHLFKPSMGPLPQVARSQVIAGRCFALRSAVVERGRNVAERIGHDLGDTMNHRTETNTGNTYQSRGDSWCHHEAKTNHEQNTGLKAFCDPGLDAFDTFLKSETFDVGMSADRESETKKDWTVRRQ